MTVVAVGARSPLGLTAEASAAAARARISRVREHPFMVDRNGEPIRCAVVPGIDLDLALHDRLAIMAIGALEEALAKLPAGTKTARSRLFLAMSECRPGLARVDQERVARAVQARWQGPVEPVYAGHAAAIRAAEIACSSRRPYEPLVAIVGVDSNTDREALKRLDDTDRLARVDVRGGMFPGEAAACLLLAARPHATYPHRTMLVGACTAQDETRPGDESFGEAMSRAIEGAVAGLDPLPRQIDRVHCDINGERCRSEEWGFSVLRTAPLWRSHDCLSTCEYWGDVGAASAALAAVLVCQGIARGFAADRRILVTASSEGGMRGAMLLCEPNNER
jgi:3-oxoacyl-[acyl-carrier-protein] synthase-1